MGSASAPGAPSLEPRRHMLLLEFEKVQQDLTVHTNEIHSKLVDIMQDRLVAAARQLTAEAGTWGASNGTVNSNGNKAGPMSSSSSAAGAPFLPPGFEPCTSMRSLAKQLGTLQAVLVPILQQEELQYIFGRVASLYSEALAVTLDSLPARDGGAWEEARRCNALFALQVCARERGWAGQGRVCFVVHSCALTVVYDGPCLTQGFSQHDIIDM
jgi:hypothetical protein